MPSASAELLTMGMAVCLVAAAAAVALAWVAWRAARHPAARAVATHRAKPPADVAELGLAVADLQVAVDRLRAAELTALRHQAVVRYDALHEMGGRMSFSVALLDGAGDGLVLTVINGRSEARTYVKGVVGRVGRQELSPEERQAVEAAVRGARRPEPATV